LVQSCIFPHSTL